MNQIFMYVGEPCQRPVIVVLRFEPDGQLFDKVPLLQEYVAGSQSIDDF